MKKIIFSLILLFSAHFITANTIPEEIISAFGSGNSNKLAQYFNATIELIIFNNNNEEIYSKTQAEIIIRDFFNKHKPIQFKILHQGGKDVSKYAIGQLICVDAKYRVTLLIKSEGNRTLIHQLRIDNDTVE